MMANRSIQAAVCASVLAVSATSWAEISCPSIDPNRSTTDLENVHLANIVNAINTLKALLASGKSLDASLADPTFQSATATIACDYSGDAVILIPSSSSFAGTWKGRTAIQAAWAGFVSTLAQGDLSIIGINYADAIVMVEWNLTTTDANGVTTTLINDGIDTYVATYGRYHWQTLHLPL